MSTSKHLRSSLTRLAVLGVSGSLALGGASALAVHENVEFPAAIHAGSCEMPGEVVMELPNLMRLPAGAPAEGERAGAPGAQVVHGLADDSEVALTVGDLFAADHILAVFNADGDTIVACGPIGAYTYAEGEDLAIGLREQGDSMFSGVALFDNDDDDEELEVHVYLVNSTPAPAPEATPTA